MSTEDTLLAALRGQSGGSLVDQLDAALRDAWTLSKGLDIAVPATGGDPGPYRPGGSPLDLAVDQTCARWGTAPKARTLAEKAALLETLVRGIDAKRRGSPTAPAPAPAPAPSAWKPLPVLTAKAATGERSSFQSAIPEFGPDGMTVSLPARGDKSGTPNPTKRGDETQRCEILLAGWDQLTGAQYLRFDFTLADGFPVDTTDWAAIAQLKNSGKGSPPLEVMIGRGEVYLQWHDAAGNETGRETLGKATTGVRHSVVLRVPFSTGKSLVGGWYDGAAVFSAEHGGTLYVGQSSYCKIGCYRSNRIGKAATVVHHGVARGTTFSAVAG